MDNPPQVFSKLPLPSRARLLHVISSLDPRCGGPAEGLRQICGYVNCRSESSVEVVSLDDPKSTFLSDFDAAPVTALGPTIGKYAYSPLLRPWLRQNGRRFDAVVVHGLWQYHGLAVWLERKQLGGPYFQFTHGMLDPWFKRNYPLKHVKKWLYWSCGQYRVLRDAAGVLFTCEEESILAPESFSRYRANPIVVGYGISAPPTDSNAQRLAFLSSFPELENKRYLLFFGRLHPKKGCDLLLDAFAQIAPGNLDLRLVMAGPGDADFIRCLKQRAEKLRISSRITWTGMLSGDAKWGALRCADGFVLPSHQENFGIAVAEAMACGTPVLISDKVNIWREVAHDGAGLVAPDDVAGTLKLLSGWVELSADARAAMRIRAASAYNKRFRIEKFGARFLDTVATPAAAIRTWNRVAKRAIAPYSLN